MRVGWCRKMRRCIVSGRTHAISKDARLQWRTLAHERVHGRSDCAFALGIILVHMLQPRVVHPGLFALAQVEVGSQLEGVPMPLECAGEHVASGLGLRESALLQAHWHPRFMSPLEQVKADHEHVASSAQGAGRCADHLQAVAGA